MNNKKIIFMGTPSISAYYLDFLIKNNFNILSVFTQPPRKKNRGMQVHFSPVQDLATQHNIPVHTPKRLDNDSINLIAEYKADLIIVIAYGLIIPNEILNLPIFGCINIHLSLLPRWRGASPIEHTLLSGDSQSGITIIKLINKLDAGPILAQEKIIIEKEINKDDLINKLKKIGSILLINNLPKLFNNEIILRNQIEQYATYAGKINSEMRKLDFRETSINVYNKIRAYSPSPGAWFKYKNERIKIISAKINKIKAEPQTILNKNFEIGCLEGSISPIYLQREGKKVMSIKEFLRGFDLVVGDKLDE